MPWSVSQCHERVGTGPKWAQSWAHMRQAADAVRAALRSLPGRDVRAQDVYRLPPCRKHGVKLAQGPITPHKSPSSSAPGLKRERDDKESADQGLQVVFSYRLRKQKELSYDFPPHLSVITASRFPIAFFAPVA